MVVNRRNFQLGVLQMLICTSTSAQTFYKMLDARGITLPPPPSDDFAESQLLVAMKPLRTPKRVAAIKAQAGDPTPLFWATAGARPAEHTAFAGLVNDVQDDVERVVRVLKIHFSRRRPSHVNPDVSPVIEVPGHAAYPSGHSTQAHMMARLFGRQFPAAKTRLDALASEIAINREVAGLHYPSDTAAGIALASALWARLR